jgi:hypothetical protein
MTEDEYIANIKKVFPTATNDEVMQIMLLIEQSFTDGWEDGFNEAESNQ